MTEKTFLDFFATIPYRVLNRKGGMKMKQLESSLSRLLARGPRALAGLAAGFFILALAGGCQKDEKTGPPGPPAVEVVDVAQKDVPVYYEWVGTLDGFVNATIRAQVTGYLVKQNYRDGDLVKKGQVLFEIDPRTFEAALAQAKGTLDQTKGTLDQSKAGVEVQEAHWATAKANLARVKPLAEQNAVSQKDLDDAVGMEQSTRASLLASRSSVVAAQASVAAAQAAVDKAQLDLGFTKIISPIDGIAGIAKAQIGNLVGPGSTEELTTVSTVDPIKVYAAISEQEYLKAAERQSAQRERLGLEMILADGSLYPRRGEIAFADRQVDVRTGTIRVASIFPNPNNMLRPGQFARIRAEIEVKKGALVIPQRAVTELQGKYLVAVVGPENKVSIKQVKAGARAGQLWVIEQGLQAGEKVVAEGTQKVREGMVVNPKPFGTQAPAEASGAQKPEGKPQSKPEAK
jgi:membrane fusion protein (multidrug efflux system)